MDCPSKHCFICNGFSGFPCDTSSSSNPGKQWITNEQLDHIPSIFAIRNKQSLQMQVFFSTLLAGSHVLQLKNSPGPTQLPQIHLFSISGISANDVDWFFHVLSIPLSSSELGFRPSFWYQFQHTYCSCCDPVFH